MKLEHLTNREPIGRESVAPGEVIENVQICPLGDFPNGGREQHYTLEATTPGGYAAFPAQELIRTKTRKQPRNWAKR